MAAPERRRLRTAADVEDASYLRLLVLGGPKVGKTTTVIKTLEAAFGKGFVINSDDEHSLRPAARETKNFDWGLALGDELQAIENVLADIRAGVRDGVYKWVCHDTISKYAARIERFFEDKTRNAAGDSDGRRYWPMYRKHLHALIDRLFLLPVHVVVNAHYVDVAGALLDGQLEKTGAGIVPLLGGQCRATIPAEFQDVVFLEKRAGVRKFVTSSDGVWGPGCRSLPGVAEIEADVGEFWRRATAKDSRATKSTTTQTQTPNQKSKTK